MLNDLKLKAASVLYRFSYPLYRKFYFNYKSSKDKKHLEFIKRFVGKGSVILDIGANIGFYSKFFSSTAGPSGKVYCFEPDPINFGHLQNELKGLSNTVMIPKAVAATSGQGTLYHSPLLNVDHRTYETGTHRNKTGIEKISIDDFVAGNFKVDFIKLDIQGGEMEALKGMKQTLLDNESLTLFMEVWNHGLKKAGSSAIELFDFLTSQGLNVYEFNDRLSVLKRNHVVDLGDNFFDDLHILASRKHIGYES